MSKIVIDINDGNKAKKFKEESLFQIESFNKVIKILKNYKVDNSNNISDCRVHNTIFIDGDRGVGKTAFMINIEHFYKDKFKEKNDFIFFNPIDPTLLETSEKFLSVVLAKIVETVQKRIDRNYINYDDHFISDDCEKKYNNTFSKNCLESYFKSLEKVSKSLEAVKTLNSDLGIEEIASYKSSLKLEQHTHEFFQVITKMFDVKALVMLIDDVDMAFDKGFDVLEVVRKYLASPYLVPIVAGDMKLYKEIIETKFMNKIDFVKDVEVLEKTNRIRNMNTDVRYFEREPLYSFEEIKEVYVEKRDLIHNLVEQYIHKVFPSENHIKLVDMFTILKVNEVYVKINNKIIPYTELKDFEI